MVAGRAFSNVFDGQRMVGHGTDQMVLRGPILQAPVGLLCLNEHFRHCEVGNHFKSPRVPIWICCMESHYTVVFTFSREPPAADAAPFDLVYYDQLGNQDEMITLTVSPGALTDLPDDDDLVPPLDQTLRTRWPLAALDWHGTDPLL